MVNRLNLYHRQNPLLPLLPPLLLHLHNQMRPILTPDGMRYVLLPKARVLFLLGTKSVSKMRARRFLAPTITKIAPVHRL